MSLQYDMHTGCILGGRPVLIRNPRKVSADVGSARLKGSAVATFPMVSCAAKVPYDA